MLEVILRDRNQADRHRTQHSSLRWAVGGGGWAGRPLGMAHALLLSLGGRSLGVHLNVMLFTCMCVIYVLSQLSNIVIHFFKHKSDDTSSLVIALSKQLQH